MATYRDFDERIASLSLAEAADVRDRIERIHQLGGYGKAAAILAGADRAGSTYGDNYNGQPFLKSLVDARRGDPQANDFIKAVLGTSAATGGAIIPNNFVAGIAEWQSAENTYRRICNFVTVTNTAAVDVPYDRDDIQAALKQGAYGSNKDVRDFGFGEATATLYQLAQIADIGNQLLRQSNGAAEAHARRRLGRSFAKAEAVWINSGTGSSQPLGLLQSFTNTYIGNFITALNSEPKVAAIGRAIGALESRAQTATAIVMGPVDYWELVTETLGTNDEGGFAVLPGDTTGSPQLSVWGVPIYRDLHWPSAGSGTAIVGNFAPVEVYVDGEMRIDVSDQAGARWDSNVTGFRAEEMVGFTADPWYLTGHFQKVTGL